MPCDPAYPDDRLQVYMEDGGATVLVTSAELQPRAERLAPEWATLQVRQ